MAGVAGVLALVGFAGASPSASAVEINSQDTVWIYGQRISQTESCWGSSARPILQIKRDGVWTTVARGKMTRSSACTKKAYPMKARYTFVLEDLGTKDFDGRTYTLEARTVSDGYKYPFTKTVYESRDDHAADLMDTLMSTAGSSSSTSSSTRGWNGCSYNGIPMYGKVKLVSSGADVVVRETFMFPDLKVEEVSMFPNSCGEWQFVTYGEDFTVQITESSIGADFDIEFVSMFPGR